MFIRIGGVPGVGKTSAIKTIIAASQELGLPIEQIHGKNILMQLAGITSEADFRLLTEAQKEKLRPQMYEHMFRIDRENPGTLRLRDAHFTMLSPDGKIIECPIMLEDKSQTLLLVLLHAGEEIVCQRRSADLGRPDRTSDIHTVAREIQLEHECAFNQSQSSGIPLYPLSSEGNIIDTCLKITRLIPIEYGSKQLEAYFTLSHQERRY